MREQIEIDASVGMEIEGVVRDPVSGQVTLVLSGGGMATLGIVGTADSPVIDDEALMDDYLSEEELWVLGYSEAEIAERGDPAEAREVAYTEGDAEVVV